MRQLVKITDRIKEEVLEMDDQGFNREEIAEDLGISVGSVRNILKEEK